MNRKTAIHDMIIEIQAEFILLGLPYDKFLPVKNVMLKQMAVERQQIEQAYLIGREDGAGGDSEVYFETTYETI